jgi:hypothetical protein
LKNGAEKISLTLADLSPEGLGTFNLGYKPENYRQTSEDQQALISVIGNKFDVKVFAP